MASEMSGPGFWFWLTLAGAIFMFVQEIVAVFACQRRDGVRLHLLRVETHKMRLKVKRELAIHELFEMQQREARGVAPLDGEMLEQHADVLIAQAEDRVDLPDDLAAKAA